MVLLHGNSVVSDSQNRVLGHFKRLLSAWATSDHGRPTHGNGLGRRGLPNRVPRRPAGSLHLGFLFSLGSGAVPVFIIGHSIAPFAPCECM